jgi:hypothetical protein
MIRTRVLPTAAQHGHQSHQGQFQDADALVPRGPQRITAHVNLTVSRWPPRTPATGASYGQGPVLPELRYRRAENATLPERAIAKLANGA